MNKTNGCSNDNFEEIQIPVPWGHIAGKWWGSKNVQPILAIHGWQDNAGTFDNLAPLLVSRGHSILCIDLPGHGLSSHYAPGYYYYVFWDGLPIVRRIVKHFQWENITIIGHSLGGAIAFLYAAVYPNDVKKYVSIDIASPSVRDADQINEHMGDALDKFLKYEKLSESSIPCYDYNEMINIVEDAYKGGVTRKNCEVMMRRGMRKSTRKKDCFVFNRDPRLKLAAMGMFTYQQVMDFAKRIRCEVLNIKGDPGYSFDHYHEVLDEIEEHAQRLERHIVKGTHHLHLNNPEDIVDIVHKFLVK